MDSEIGKVCNCNARPDVKPATPQFTGFSLKGLDFLTGLAEAQNREWFEAHRAIYETELKDPMSALIAALGFAFQVHDIPLSCDPKRAIFRIHRDIRFSKDKRPYKTHIGASLTRSGEKLAPGLVYIHVDPTGSFVAAGCYRPEPPILHKLRLRIVERSDEFVGIVARLDDAGLSFDTEDSLTRVPRGFDAVDDEQIAVLLRLKSFIVRRPLDLGLLTNADRLIAAIIAFAETTHPLLRFIWKGVV